MLLTPLGPQSRFGDKLLEICLVCPQNGTAVLKGLTVNPVSTAVPIWGHNSKSPSDLSPKRDWGPERVNDDTIQVEITVYCCTLRRLTRSTIVTR